MSFERPNIEQMQGYTPGEQPDAASVIKLNTNENPYPASPEVLAALQSIQIESLRRYPPPLADEFRQAAAELNNVDSCNIVPTNGGDELLRLAITTFLDSGDTIAVTKPSYSLYPVLADIQGCRLEEIPLQDDWSMPSNFIATVRASKAKMLILVNPHAPTGKLLSTDYLAEVAENFAGVLIIDEAYVDFIEPEKNYLSPPLIAAHENLLILRTLSKGYSLAGLRFGYGIGAESLVSPMLFKTRDSYNTDYIAQKLATAALRSVSYARDNWQKVRTERALLQNSLNDLGLVTAASQSNFLLTQIPSCIDAESLCNALKQRDILVRYFDQDRLRDKIRISIGTAAENANLLSALQDIVSKSSSS